MSRRISAVICDKNSLFREGLRHIIREHGYRVTASVSSLDELQAGVWAKSGATLLIVGLVEISDDDLKRLRVLRRCHPSVHTMVLVDRCNGRQISNVLDARIDCLLLKSTSGETLLKSLELVLMNEHVITVKAEAADEDETAEFRGPPPVQPAPAESSFAPAGGKSEAMVLNYARNGLSERERDILSCLVRGCSNKIIARQCNITEATVKVHMKAILRKIQVRNRTQAAIWAMGRDLRPSVPAAIQTNAASGHEAMASLA